VDAALSALKGEQKRQHFFERLMWKPWGQAALVFALGFVAAFVLLAATEGLISTDDYYHSRAAAQIIEQRAIRLYFPWLPLTILSPTQFVDHHLLYHLYLAPWVYWGGIVGAKLAQSFVVAGVFVALWSLLRALKVRYVLLWSIGLLGVSSPFLYRILMVRTQGAALLLLLVALQLLFRRHYRWLVVVAFAFTWLYNGFVLLPAIAALYVLSVFISDRRVVWQALAYALLGTGLGLFINPYFPQNVVFIVSHLGEKVNVEASIRVGSEWYPYTTQALLENSPGALLALVAGVLAPSFFKARRSAVETTLLLVALLTLTMTFESRRFIEYFPPFALLFCAASWGRHAMQRPNEWVSVRFRPLISRVYPAGLALLLLLLTWTTVSAAYGDIQNAEDAGYMAGAARWLQEHTEPNTLVFQTDWDDFPYLFYFNTHNTYLVGLDPTYLQVAHPTLWNLWVPITQGAVERPSTLIRENFGARYIISDLYHEAFAARANGDPNMRLVYRDDNSLIWQIEDSEPAR
jgi:hypothetical protein